MVRSGVPAGIDGRRIVGRVVGRVGFAASRYGRRVGHAGRGVARHVHRQGDHRVAGGSRQGIANGVQVSVASVQVQPVPESAVAVNPAGSVSVTVTVPLVEAEPYVGDGEGVGRSGLALREVAAVGLRDGQVGGPGRD